MWTKKIKIFVSYTVHDGAVTKVLLEKIKQRISSFAEPYIDLLNENTLQETVEKAVRESALLLVILTEKVYESKWVAKELEIAREYDIPIIPMTAEQILSLNEKECVEYIFGYNNQPRPSKRQQQINNSVFISHSNSDKIFVQQICNLFKYMGYSTYVDWLDRNLPRYTSEITAVILKERIEENDKFILVATNSAIRSYWCNWELGLGDEKKYKLNKIALFPIHDPKCRWINQEYLRIYPTIHFFEKKRLEQLTPGFSLLRKNVSFNVWNIDIEFKELINNSLGNNDPSFWKEKKSFDHYNSLRKNNLFFENITKILDPYKWFINPIRESDQDLYVFFPTDSLSKSPTSINVDVVKLSDWLQME
jgi:hypothetical protein